MAEFPALPLFTDAYFGDTRHLSCLEHGAYLQLLMIAWRSRDCRLPCDDLKLSRYVGLTMSQWRRIKPTILEFFEVDGDRIYQRRLLDEREAVRQHRESQSRKGIASALKRKGRHSTPVEPRCNLPTPTPFPVKREAKASPKSAGSRLSPEWILPDDWAQWTWREMGWQRTAIAEEAERFKDYWMAKSGKDATKVDWQATWRNWCRNSRRPKPAQEKLTL